jgi:hypothetical protein
MFDTVVWGNFIAYLFSDIIVWGSSIESSDTVIWGS